jgi:hypothetical protein
MPLISTLGTGDQKAANDGDTKEGWSNWSSLGGTCLSAPVVASRGKNQLDVFAVGTNSQVYHLQIVGQQISNWQSLGGTCVYKPAAIASGENRLDVFVIGIDKQIYQKSWNGQRWNDWKALGGTCIYGVAATSFASGRIDLFTVGTDSMIYHTWGDGQTWQPQWKSLVLEGQKDLIQSSTCVCAPAAVASSPSRIDIFTLGIDNDIYHAWGNGETWQGWENVGGPAIHGVAAASRSENSLDLFTISTDASGTDNHLYHRSMQSGAWSSWENLGGICISAPVAIAPGANQLETFVIGSQNNVWRKNWGSRSTQ